MRYLFIASCFLFSLATHAQHTWWDILYCINGGENKSVRIPFPPPPNPVEKFGWYLIFHDEFDIDTIDIIKWNKSNPWDDGDGSCFRDFAMNPANVEVSGSFARILNTAVPSLADCPYSAGEIKSISVRDTGFKCYYFYAPGYMEARVKLFNKPGQGAAMWLWGVGEPESPGIGGPWNEIDVFELNGINNNIVHGTYHWTDSVTHVFQTQRIYLTDTLGLYDLSSNWTIFGLEWNDTAIIWTINNTVVKDLDLKRIPPYCLNTDHYDKPVAPFCIRFGTGRNPVGDQGTNANPADFPQTMQIDYIRVYKEQGQMAAPIAVLDGIRQICSSDTSAVISDKILYSRYYPGVTYEWSSPAFNYEPVPTAIPQPPEKIKIWIKPGTQANHLYPVYLKTTFPWNFVENDTLQLYIPDGPPPLPSDSLFAFRIDSLCYYAIGEKASIEGPVCQFSLDGGLTWNRGNNIMLNGREYFYFGQFRPFDTVAFAFRTINGCGISPVRFSSMIMPAPEPNCSWPAGTEDENNNSDNFSNTLVKIFPNPFIDKLDIRLSGRLMTNKKDFHFILSDLTGKKIIEKNFDNDSNPLDLDFVSPGLYFIQIKNGSEMIYYGKIIKQ